MPLYPICSHLELGLQPAADPDSGLSALAQRHAVLSGKPINWLGLTSTRETLADLHGTAEIMEA